MRRLRPVLALAAVGLLASCGPPVGSDGLPDTVGTATGSSSGADGTTAGGVESSGDISTDDGVGNDGIFDSGADTGEDPLVPCILVSRPTELAFDVVDAEMSDALDRIVVVSETDAALLVLDPSTFSIVASAPSVAKPNAVSVSPNGMQAAVGHNGAIDLVDLMDAVTLSSVLVPFDVADLAHGGNGFVYAVANGNGAPEIQAVEIDSGAITAVANPLGYSSNAVHVQPGATALYAGRHGYRRTPPNTEKYSIEVGVPAYEHAAPEATGCLDFWFADDGARIFDTCGAILRASDDVAMDLQQIADLEDISLITALDHHGVVDRVALVEGMGFIDKLAARGKTALSTFDGETAELLERCEFPELDAHGQPVPLHGMFVFFSVDGARVHVFAQVDPDLGVAIDWVALSI